MKSNHVQADQTLPSPYAAARLAKLSAVGLPQKPHLHAAAHPAPHLAPAHTPIAKQLITQGGKQQESPNSVEGY